MPHSLPDALDLTLIFFISGDVNFGKRSNKKNPIFAIFHFFIEAKQKLTHKVMVGPSEDHLPP